MLLRAFSCEAQRPCRKTLSRSWLVVLSLPERQQRLTVSWLLVFVLTLYQRRVGCLLFAWCSQFGRCCSGDRAAGFSMDRAEVTGQCRSKVSKGFLCRPRRVANGRRFQSAVWSKRPHITPSMHDSRSLHSGGMGLQGRGCTSSQYSPHPVWVPEICATAYFLAEPPSECLAEV